MRQLLAITDVTLMWEDMVCIAGVTQDLRCIRPVADGGVRIWTLYKSREPIIYPGSKRVFLKHVILSRSGAQAKNLTTLTVGWSGDASGFALSMTGCLSSGNTFENTL